MTLGLVCDACDALSPINATVCQLCGASLGVGKSKQSSGPKAAVAEPFGRGSAGGDAAKVCAYCGEDIAPGHRFCGNCGKPMLGAGAPAPAPAPVAQPQPARPGNKPAAKTMFFGAMQAPAPKLIL